MVKETKKFDREKRVLSTHFAHFWSVLQRRHWMHWQVGINPQQASAISRMRSPQNQRPGLLNRFALACHSFTQAHRRVSKVQQKTCSLGEQRTRAPSILSLSWRIPDEPPRWKVVAEWKDTGILGLRRRRIQSGARDEAWLLRAFV